MLTLTKKTEYAVIATCHLAHVDDGVVSARDIAECYGIRLPLLMNVLKSLNQRGILRSERGARGGYALVANPRKIALSQLIEAVEGAVRLVRCAVPHPADQPCDLGVNCPVRGPLIKVHHLFGGFLNEVTVADLAFDDAYRGVKSLGQRESVVQ